MLSFRRLFFALLLLGSELGFRGIAKAAQDLKSNHNRIYECVGLELIDKGGRIELFQIKLGSPAEKSGLKRGDILLDIGGMKVISKEDVYRLLPGFSGGPSIPVSINSSSHSSVRLSLSFMMPMTQEERKLGELPVFDPDEAEGSEGSPARVKGKLFTGVQVTRNEGRNQAAVRFQSGSWVQYVVWQGEKILQNTLIENSLRSDVNFYVDTQQPCTRTVFQGDLYQPDTIIEEYYWYPNGQRFFEKKYLDRLPEGVWHAWYPNGTLAAMLIYEKHRLIKSAYWDSHGKSSNWPPRIPIGVPSLEEQIKDAAIVVRGQLSEILESQGKRIGKLKVEKIIQGLDLGEDQIEITFKEEPGIFLGHDSDDYPINRTGTFFLLSNKTSPATYSVMNGRGFGKGWYSFAIYDELEFKELSESKK